ncbi:pre-rRNA-processing protein TSR2 [Colletotrichum karsti]|uniref:Pre-rRNA-processing protein TSR2 n=1 Tax=Colletotrichum karsti TaxID=1095194 RepID=A0A9P6I975_9PEZI|nr:pre-rRNA-processing protein TSR2 [Colletotrichum karsti]KAF9876261.1 pre-rRNA-processing protein TSR2 [Colletotrichum karsti]
MATTGPITAEACQSSFEQAVALSLHMWPALSLAVQNNWGGPDSADKRDWFAGAVAELFPTYSKVTNGQAVPAANAVEEPDTEYVETFLLQVMVDEFEVNVDDETGFDVAERIIKLRADCAKGKFDAIDDLRQKWDSRKGAKVEGLYKKMESGDQETDWEDDSEDDEDEDVDMDEAPQLVSAPKEKPQPEVDEDGFTMVTKKKR